MTRLLTFHPFPRLQIEIRQNIWKLTLEPRVVELEFLMGHGFFPSCSTPVALRVNQDSRNAVAHMYSICFGSSWYSPQTRFNFSLVTLYLDHVLHEQIPFFFSILSSQERASLLYLAIQSNIWEYLTFPGLDGKEIIQKINREVESFGAFRELLVVANPVLEHDNCNWTGDYSSSSPIGLYKTLPTRLDHPELQIMQYPNPDFVYAEPWNDIEHTLVWGLRRLTVATPVSKWSRDEYEENPWAMLGWLMRCGED